MTTEAYTPAAPALVQGVGPYAIPHAYTPGSIRAAVQVGAELVELSPADFTVTPEASDSAGQLMLAPATAALYAGRLLFRRRATAVQQGWQGVLGNREKGLERQLDILAQGLQEYVDVAARSLRAPIPMPEFVPAPGRALIFDAHLRPVMGPNAADIAAAAPAAAAAVAAADRAEAAAVGVVLARGLVEAQTGAWLLAMPDGLTPRRDELFAIDRAVRRLVDAGVWAKLSLLSVFCGDRAAASLYDLRNPAITWAAAEGAAHHRGSGWGLGAGASDAPVLTATATPATLTAQTAATLGVLIAGSGASPAVVSAPLFALTPCDGSGPVVRLHQATAWLPEPDDLIEGFSAVVRDGTALRWYRDGVLIATDTLASTAAPSATPVQILRGDGNHRVAAVFAGAVLDAEDIHILAQALSALRAEIGDF